MKGLKKISCGKKSMQKKVHCYRHFYIKKKMIHVPWISFNRYQPINNKLWRTAVYYPITLFIVLNIQ